MENDEQPVPVSPSASRTSDDAPGPEERSFDLAEIISRGLPDDIPPDDVPELTQSILHQITAVSLKRETSIAHSGPLPAPQTLAGYEDVLPGSPQRILGMAERSMAHGAAMDRADSRRATSGLWMGYSALLLLIGAGTYCATEQYTEGLAIFLGAAVLGVIGRFLPVLRGKQSDSN